MFRRLAVDPGWVSSVPRPLLALLAATVLVFALYTVALKPATSGGGGGSNPGAYQSAIAKARAVQGLVNAAGARAGGTPASTPPATGQATPSSTPSHKPAASSSLPTTSTASKAKQHHEALSPSAGHAKGNGTAPPSVASLAAPGTVMGTITPHRAAVTAAERFHAVQVALEQHKVLALLFYNPASSDDKAVEAEMSSISTHGGAVVKLAVPIQEVAAYSSLLSQVPVNYSPTLMLIDRNGQAEEIAGYASAFEIDQRVSQDLGS